VDIFSTSHHFGELFTTFTHNHIITQLNRFFNPVLNKNRNKLLFIFLCNFHKTFIQKSVIHYKNMMNITTYCGLKNGIQLYIEKTPQLTDFVPVQQTSGMF